MQLLPETIAAAHAHALADYPREAVGAVLADGAYQPLSNAAANPGDQFLVPRREWARVIKKTIAVLHSHPDADPWPSRLDMEQQLATNRVWGVFACNGSHCSEIRLWGDGLPPADLLNRPFVHGIADCYSLVRDYYRLHHGVALPEVPRGWNWWDNHENLYLDHLTANGFRVIPRDEVRAGDGFLLQTPNSPVINHAGIVWATDLALHHLQKRPSRIEALFPWMDMIKLWVRHKDVNNG